jgi:hypothetical protein
MMVPHSTKSSDHIQSAVGLDSLGVTPAASCKCIWIMCIRLYLFFSCFVCVCYGHFTQFFVR